MKIFDWWALFLVYVRHYSLALWGIRQRLDPDYKPTRVTESGDVLFEWRTYGLFPLWAVLVAWGLPPAVVAVLVALWAFLAWRRARFYRSSLEFWRRAVEESPNKARCWHFYGLELMTEAERRMKAGEPYADLNREAVAAIDRVSALMGQDPTKKWMGISAIVWPADLKASDICECGEPLLHHESAGHLFRRKAI